MQSFRDFAAGPDPFGRNWQVLFKWQQNAISIRHSDSVDVKFVVTSEEERTEKTVALSHPHLLELSDKTGHALTDAWCSKLAALHLKHMIETGEDMEQELVTPTPEQLAVWAAQLS